MKIYVVTHKAIEEPLPKNYEYIQVNAEKNGQIFPLTDATGDNISAKNPYYCELTAAYWIWKNDRENDVVGLAHYRRFLTSDRFSHSPKKYINSPRIEKLLKKFDFISTKLYHTDITTKEHLLESVREHDFDLLREVISDVAPSYLNAFDQVFAGHESYLLNVFICKKELWDAYYEWLFSILFALEPRVDMTGYTVQEQRLYGYLAERLFTVYVRKNNLRVKSFPTHLVGVSKWTVIRNKLKRILHIK